ncbi:TPR-like protein [Cucurbitaria berberidis CBS 394.84]|uniref:TPR-like protein n=1 Tax=Cucurbitaria berberidis CBS 394.84 TaxID=1168544 RepID=A0A9P4GCC8_9PLEO|nr:TPR-like protein [Cucurbitaria berberidis CBS 394.84]KAF1842634.1 TPR-like protein [Cucurbitaria berberidis CBS 394.84]
MAELAALGIAASVLQIIDVGVRVVERLNDSRKNGTTLPHAFRHINTRLPVFIDALRETKSRLEDMTDSARKAIRPAIEECLIQIQKLEATLDKVLPSENESGAMRGWKAVVSVKYDNDVKEMDEVIRHYMEAMAQHRQLSSSNHNSEGRRDPPKPSSTCPFEQEPDFIDRDVMGEVMLKCQPGTKLALMGIGGVGKSRLAIEYTYRMREAFPQMWIFWVSAKDTTAIELDFRRIAKAVRLPGWDEKNTDIFTLVRDWLKDESNGPWVMVVDNLDDPGVLTATPAKANAFVDIDDKAPLHQIRDFITVSRTGSVLVTSRNRDAAQMITGNCAYHIDVEEMNEGEALALLGSKLNSKVLYIDTDAAELVKAVDYMPLAISQIATNININYPRLTIVRATEKLLSPNEDTIQLLETSMHEASRDTQRTNSIVKTWHLSFQYIRETNPSAARLLSLMCLFDRRGIPDVLLSGQYGEETTAVIAPLEPRITWWKRFRRRPLRLKRRKRSVEDKTAVQDIKSTFDDDWRVLTDFALIKTNVDGREFNMHRLVQHTTMRWLEMNGELKSWMRRYIAIMGKCFPSKPEYDNLTLSVYLSPHAQQAAAYKPTNEEALLTWAPLISSVAAHASYMSNYALAESLSRAVFELYKATLGNENEHTLRSAQQLADALHPRNHNEEAEKIYRWTLSGRQKLLGQEHKDTLHTLSCIGDLLHKRGKMEEGDAVFKKHREAKEKMLGFEHPSVQRSLHFAGLNFFLRGMFAEAEDIQRRTCTHAIATSGVGSDEALSLMSMLAATLNMQEKYDEAESLYRRILRLELQNNDGKEGLSFFNGIINLGNMMEFQQRYGEAEHQYRQAVDGFKDVYSPEHAEVLKTQERLALLLSQQKKFGEAESLARYIVDTRRRVLGIDDCDTLAGLHTLAKILDVQGKHRDAVPLFDQAYIGTKSLYGTDHPVTIEFMNDFNQAKNKQLEWVQEETDIGLIKEVCGHFQEPPLANLPPQAIVV